MFAEIWYTYLYRPLFNGLVWIYNNWTEMNLGWAIVYLTVVLRMALLPFTLVGERASALNQGIQDEIARLEKDFHNDPVQKKQEIRRVLRTRRVSPWSKAVVLGMQGLVLVLLYQVFIQGVAGERVLQVLYTSVDFPGNINTIFYGFDLAARHDYFWSGLVTIILMLEIYLSLHARKGNLERSDLAYFILFPASVFIVLWILPMVKALFILTSILFSIIIHQFSKVLFRPRKKA
jgi:YidC/Oxa1 family membrane protein insertase